MRKKEVINCNLCNGSGKLNITKGSKSLNKLCIRCTGSGTIKKLVERRSDINKSDISMK